MTVPDNFVRLVKAMYQKKNATEFLKVKKSYSTSNAWKNILNHRGLLRKILLGFWGMGIVLIVVIIIRWRNLHLLIKLRLT